VSAAVAGLLLLTAVAAVRPAPEASVALADLGSVHAPHLPADADLGLSAANAGAALVAVAAHAHHLRAWPRAARHPPSRRAHSCVAQERRPMNPKNEKTKPTNSGVGNTPEMWRPARRGNRRRAGSRPTSHAGQTAP